MRGVSPIHFAVATAARCGIFGLALFGSREYLVSPILVGLRATPGHALRADEAAGKPVQLTMGEVRMQRVLDSAIAAALAGGGLSFGMRELALGTSSAATVFILLTSRRAAHNAAGGLHRCPHRLGRAV